MQSVYPSSRLTRDNELQLNKVLQFPADEKVVGHGGRCCAEYHSFPSVSYKMFLTLPIQLAMVASAM